MPTLSGFAFDSAGVALSSGITVNIYARNTTTPVVSTTSTNASGYWTRPGLAEGRYDVEIVNGTTIRRMMYDDEIQIERGEFKNLQIRGSDNAFALTFVLGAIAAARNLTIPTLTGNDTMAVLGMAQTFTATQTMTSPVIITSLTTSSTTFALVNTTATTVNFAGAATTLNIGAAASATTWTGQSFSLTGANSTNNTTFTVQNTSNAAAASHSIVDVSVGGTTSTGDPQYRLTIPSGTSWYIGVDNSDSDIWKLGTGTAVGTSRYYEVDARSTTTGVAIHKVSAGANLTVASGASNLARLLVVDSINLNYTGTTQVTSLVDWIQFNATTIAGDTATLTVDKATSISVAAPIEGTNVDLTVTSAIRVLTTSGAPTHQVGLVVESLTGGATSNLALWVQNPIQLGNATVNTTANQFHTASQGAASTTMWIGNASINVTSDIRAKENVEPWGGDALSLLRRFTVVEYDYRDGYRPFGGVYSGRYVGLTAQHLYDVAPWAVNTQGGKDCWECRAGLPCEDHLPWQARYELLTGVLVKGLQELDQRVSRMEEKVHA